MHLKFPSKKFYYEWQELSCLSRALGFHPRVITECIPADLVRKEDGISHRELMKLINLKFFNDALDRSANMHTADYNINVLKKSIDLLNHRLLSFDELSEVRVAFQVYEAGDMRGMMIDQQTLMRTLKLCGRTVAPLKLMHRVKHMERRLDEPGRLQFYEFLDLIVLCELTDVISVPDPKHKPLDKTWRKLFELDHFENIFATYDEKLEGFMNSLFVQEERNYGHERLGSTRIPKEAAVETSARKKLVKFHKKKYKELHKSISESTTELKKTKAGVIRPRPVTAPDVEEFRLPSRMSKMSSHSTDQERPHTVAEFLNLKWPHSPAFHSRPQTAPPTTHCQSMESMKVDDPRVLLLLNMHKRKTLKGQPNRQLYGSSSAPQLGPRLQEVAPWTSKPISRVQTPLVVTNKDVCQRQRLLDSLQYEIETLEERAYHELADQLERTVPHYKNRKAAEREEAERERMDAEKGAKKKKVKKKFPIQEEKKTDPIAFDRITHRTPKSFYKEHNKNCSSKQVALPSSRPVVMKTCKQSGQLQDGKVLTDTYETLRKGLNEATSSVSSIGDVSNASDMTRHIGTAATMTPYRGILQSPNKMGSHQFEVSRVGTAAVLYDYLSVDGGDTDKEEYSKPSQLLISSDIQTDRREKNEDIVCDSTLTNDVKASLKEPSILPVSHVRTPDSRKVRWEKTKVSRKVTVFDDDELKLYGVPLSEIDKLTQKSESLDLGDLSQIQAAINGR
ncbi:uncharacterized protein [Apostichopus japonicus]|uniref:uncharacterized protein isoform X1 n=2 Tax=Stichopus japonicus TaxID=307972 RepID=UPI003AB64465